MAAIRTRSAISNFYSNVASSAIRHMPRSNTIPKVQCQHIRVKECVDIVKGRNREPAPTYAIDKGGRSGCCNTTRWDLIHRPVDLQPWSIHRGKEQGGCREYAKL